MTDPENGHKFGSNCDKRSLSVVVVFVFLWLHSNPLWMPHETLKKFFVLYVSINLILHIRKKKKWVSLAKRVLNTKMKYDTKMYFSQNCPHNKKFDRSLAKTNLSYNLMVWKILFQTNLMVTVTV